MYTLKHTILTILYFISYLLCISKSSYPFIILILSRHLNEFYVDLYWSVETSLWLNLLLSIQVFTQDFWYTQMEQNHHGLSSPPDLNLLRNTCTFHSKISVKRVPPPSNFSEVFLPDWFNMLINAVRHNFGNTIFSHVNQNILVPFFNSSIKRSSSLICQVF